ncbi:MAG: carbon-nitrogen hydrolase family protein [Desulfurococcales archaeon]|nr:carbon-nitrogen hydrolase family protein [Desulfurococcales archaeon]
MEVYNDDEREDVIRIAIIHGKIRYQARRQNIHKLSASIEEAMSKEEPPQLLILPPYPLTGPLIGYNSHDRTMRYIKSNAERINEKGYTTQFIWQRITLYTASVLAGPIIERAGPKLFNTMLLVDQDHHRVLRYRKISVSPLEAKYRINPGKEPGLLSIPGPGGIDKRLGVFIENDIMHPEIFRILSLMGSWVIIGSILPLPYMEPLVTSGESEEAVYTVNSSLLESFASVRAMETGVPVIIVGGIIENLHGELMAESPTIIADPELGVVKVQRDEDILRLDITPPEKPSCTQECTNVLNAVQKYYRHKA